MKALIALVLAVSAINAVAEPVQLPDLEIELPAKIGEFEFSAKKQYDDPGLGYQVAYAQRMGLVTIYVYDLNKDDIPSGIASEIIKNELAGAEAEIEKAGKTGQYKNLKTHALEDELVSHVNDQFVTSSWTFDIPGGGCKSYVFLRGQAGKILKVRATMYVVDGKAEDQALANFIKTLIEEITAGEQDGAEKPAIDIGV